ncbi:WhiB family transcriptional regulator [Streptomyces sp. HNM0645]|uniref:WhiB family transcriptional regulator n=1 Tax=Streptomyces sp. HNM0645 TaxID=2782343 RepID=UPI0024B80DF5|nr:WhiB family transcriptional regulator [Streptomyces sp. HNM0645]MDI9883442.1 WhiB family transcriptional regulator [Streptomyces sp. HNM0645]
MSWRLDAMCLGEDPDLFFPVGSGDSGPTLIQTAEAKAVCRRCPVVRQCLDWAVGRGPVDGIWGGTTERERRAAGRHRPDDSGMTGGTARREPRAPGA